MLVFFLITLIVSFSFENFSILTGFPFGFYHYSPSLGMLTVPLVIIFAYFAIGYLSWVLSHVLTGQYSKKLEGKQIFIVPFIAAFLMVMWDLTVDPNSSTLQGMWVWTYPGAYFGVPISNFLGWFLVVYIFFQLFALYISRYDNLKMDKILNKPYWSEAAAVYGIIGLGTIFSIFYQFNDITISMALVTIFTMIFVTLLALNNIWNRLY
jgi:putative membrane protein